jgi:hypothetical protein
MFGALKAIIDLVRQGVAACQEFSCSAALSLSSRPTGSRSMS